MAVDYKKLGLRIAKARGEKKLSQEQLAATLNLSREHINLIERVKSTPTLATLIEIANALGVSANDLLVDSLEHSSSTADTELHQLLLDCTDAKEKILVEFVKHMKPILYGLGI